MIFRFRKVNDHLYRGSAPSVKDVIALKKLGIKKIVSLDEESGKKIARATKLLDIKHIMLPIDIGKKTTLIDFLSQDIPKLFDEDGPTFIHCRWGKDRTGLAIAIYRCEEDGWSCEAAIAEAKKLGFGIGVDPKIVKLYEKIIQDACGCKQDQNAAYDIVSNQREYPSNYGAYTSDAWEQQSFAPYADYRIREFPYSNQDASQYDSRVSFGLNDGENKDYGGLPQSGQYNNATEGINGAGPSLVGSGYI